MNLLTETLLTQRFGLLAVPRALPEQRWAQRSSVPGERRVGVGARGSSWPQGGPGGGHRGHRGLLPAASQEEQILLSHSPSWPYAQAPTWRRQVWDRSPGSSHKREKLGSPQDLPLSFNFFPS